MSRPTRATVRAAAIVVGVDGSRGSDAALAWALEEARVRGSEVEALVVRTAGVAGREHLSYDELTAARCQDLLDESLQRIGGPSEVPLRLETRDDGLLFELGLEAVAHRAGLVVVGALSHLHAAMAPTTLARLTHRSSCPLVIVPSDYVRHRTRRITVDLEWAGERLDALRWAAEEAVVTGAALEVVGGACTQTRGIRTNHGPNPADVAPRVKEILDACTASGIRTAGIQMTGIHTTGSASVEHGSSWAASPDLLVVEMPAWPWWRGGPALRDPRPGTSLAGVPVVLVPRGALH